MTLGSLGCTTLTLQLGAANLADALTVKQRVQTSGMDSLNSCWSADSLWQLLVLEESGVGPPLSITSVSWEPSNTSCVRP